MSRAGRMQIAAGVTLFVVSVGLAVFAVRSGAPSCPLDAMYVPEREICPRPTLPPDAPSRVDLIRVEADTKLPERALIVGLGVLGGVLLILGRIGPRPRQLGNGSPTPGPR